MAIVVDLRVVEKEAHTRERSQNVLACLSRHRISNLAIGFMRQSKLLSIARDTLHWYAFYYFHCSLQFPINTFSQVILGSPH